MVQINYNYILENFPHVAYYLIDHTDIGIEGGILEISRRELKEVIRDIVLEVLREENVYEFRQNGCVFITDITPQDSNDNVGNKVFSSSGRVLDSCVTDTDYVTVNIIAFTGDSNYIPDINLSGIEISLTESEISGVFLGDADINLNGLGKLTVLHEDGPKHSVTITHENKPEILDAYFTGGYPGSQTELKEDDNFDIYFESDVDVVELKIADESACKSDTFSFSETTSNTVTSTIANRGDVAVSRYAKIRVRNTTGSWSNWYQTNAEGDVDGINTVVCNNLSPSISIDGIDYPGSQMALKSNEVAIVSNTASDFDTIVYTSPNNQLNIENQGNYETDKVVRRISGNYNISTNNLKIDLRRNANDSEIFIETVVQIANVAASVSISEQYSHLRSAPTGADYEITITSSQHLLEAPTITAPYGSWVDGSFSGGPTIWDRNIRISDSDPKGSYSWTNLVATNLAGIVTSSITGDSEYLLAGFNTRRLMFDAFSNIQNIGTPVYNTDNLVCIDISGNIFSYQVDKTNNQYSFTIVNSDGTLNPNGSYIYITDQNWVDMNSEGLAYVDLQET